MITKLLKHPKPKKSNSLKKNYRRLRTITTKESEKLKINTNMEWVQPKTKITRRTNKQKMRAKVKMRQKALKIWIH